jgi:hypothetical protein
LVLCRDTISVGFKKILECFWSKNSEKILIFNIFYKIVKKWKNSIFFTENDDAELEKEAFLHIVGRFGVIRSQQFLTISVHDRYLTVI